MAGPYPSVVTVAVGPTPTVVLNIDVRDTEWLNVQLSNLDGLQTFRGYVQRRQSPEMGWTTSTIGDFASVQPAGAVDGDGNPLDSVDADLDISATGLLRIVGLMSGAGGNVKVTYRRGMRK